MEDRAELMVKKYKDAKRNAERMIAMQLQFKHTEFAGCKDCPKFNPASPDNLEEENAKVHYAPSLKPQ